MATPLKRGGGTLSEPYQQASLNRDCTVRARLSDFHRFLKSNRPKEISLVIAYVALLGVIGAQGVPYWDDSIRRLTGGTGFGVHDGRWGSELVAILLNQGRFVVDLGLTTFILSGLVLSLAATIIIYALAGTRANWLTFALALTLGLNPWYLNAAAFRFDGPFFALSVLFSVGTILFIGARFWLMFLGYALLTWATANFFQPMLGLALILLMSVTLMGWLQGELPSQLACQRLGIGFGGVLSGGLLYLVQSLIIVPGRADVGFDFSNPLRAVVRNTRLLGLQFLQDSSPIWTFSHIAVLIIFIYGMLRISKRSVMPTIFSVLLYLVLMLFASGNILLLATGSHIISNARFMAPAAMALTILAVISSLIPLSRTMARVTQIVLIGFAYIWLSVVFVFALVLREQQDTLRFQASAVVSDLFNMYLPGDTIYFDPRIFSNSRYLSQLARVFPIFGSELYADPLNLPWEFAPARFRLAQLLGLEPDAIVPFNINTLNQCDRTAPLSDEVIVSARWSVFRAGERTVCVTFPNFFINVLPRPDGVQQIWFDLTRFPYAAGQRPDLTWLNSEDVEMAVWSVDNQADVQVVHPETLTEAVAQFEIQPPPGGWTGEILAFHIFVRDQFIYQHVWAHR